MKEKNCPECGDTFKGRVDKKFCSSACRSAFHNRQYGDVNNFMRNINNILRKNRRILAGLNPEGKTTLHRDKLIAEGFKFNYFTNEYRTRAGKVYKFCYDQGYLTHENEEYVTLVVREEYVG